MPEREREPNFFRFPHPRPLGSRPWRLAVDLFGFAGWVLLVVLVITAVWPLNVPLLALAYKVSLGGQKMPFETNELWWRSFLGALGLAGLSLVCFFIAYLTIVGAELEDYRGAVHLVLLLAYIPAAAAYLFWTYAYDDLFGPIAVFFLYILLPGLPLLAVCWLFRSLGTLYSVLP